MTQVPWQEIKDTLDDLLDEFESDLPSNEFKGMRETLRAGEYHLFFDFLCSQLYEYEIPPGPERLARIKDAAALLCLGADSWDYLGELS